MLWHCLRNRRFGGLKFRRQQPLGPYIADFFCESASLVIELDGHSHDNRVERDVERDQFMQARGLHVVRIQNSDSDFKYDVGIAFVGLTSHDVEWLARAVKSFSADGER